MSIGQVGRLDMEACGLNLRKWVEALIKGQLACVSASSAEARGLAARFQAEVDALELEAMTPETLSRALETLLNKVRSQTRS